MLAVLAGRASFRLLIICFTNEEKQIDQVQLLRKLVCRSSDNKAVLREFLRWYTRFGGVSVLEHAHTTKSAPPIEFSGEPIRLNQVKRR